MKKERLCNCAIFSMLLVFLLSDLAYGAILSSWADKKAYYPVPPVFVHGFNAGPDAWGFKIDPETEKVIDYEGTSQELFKYFDEYRDLDPDEFVRSPYVEPFNYRYNTFDKMKWNAYEGYEGTELQYPDNRIPLATRFNRPVLKRFNEGTLSKYQTDHAKIIAHSLGGPLSRWYLYKKGMELSPNPQDVAPDLYPVDQLVTLGSPHLGWELAGLANFIAREGWGDATWGQYSRLLWRVGLHFVFRGLPLERDVEMVDDMETDSEFLTEINTASHIPPLKYSCMAGFIYGPESILYPRPFHKWTDSFISVKSAWASKAGYSPSRLWMSSRDFEEEQPKSILGPDYHAVLIDRLQLEPMPLLHCKQCEHGVLTNWWELVLKEIDLAGRVEITEPKDGFSPAGQGELIVKGKVYDEYLPADCKVELKVLLEGESDERVINNPNPVSGEANWVWSLKPSDLWKADDPNSPVAEFEISIPEEYASKVEKIKVTATNPAGYTYEDEVSWNLLIVDEVTKKVYCLDGPETVSQNYPVIVNEFRLVDEEGNEIESRPLGVAWDDTLGIFHVSFDDKKIRAYNEYGELVKTNSGRGYLEVPEMPDGLVNPFNNGSGWYVSKEASKIGEIFYFDGRIGAGIDITLEQVHPNWSLVKVKPTDCVWERRHMVFWISSEEIGLVRWGWHYGPRVGADNIPLGFNPAGLIQREPYFYIASEDGWLYQKYCESAHESVEVGRVWEGLIGQYDWRKFRTYSLDLYIGYAARWWKSRNFVRYDISDLPEEFHSVKIPMLIQRVGDSLYPPTIVNVYLDVVEAGWDYYNEISWSNQPDVLNPLIHLIYPSVYSTYFSSWDEIVVDVTDVVRERLASGEEELDIRLKTDEEGEYLYRNVYVRIGPMYVEETTWAIDLLTDTPSDLGLGGKLKMRIKPGHPTSVNVGDIIQFETHGKEPLEWSVNDETVGRVDSLGKFVVVGPGSCKVKVTDALGNAAESSVIMVE